MIAAETRRIIITVTLIGIPHTFRPSLSSFFALATPSRPSLFVGQGFVFGASSTKN